MRILAVSALCAAVLVAPAVADARSWRGKTKQGRLVTVRTGTDGLVNRARVNWRAPCRKGHYVSTTFFIPPFDVSEATAFEDAGTSRPRVRGGYRARHRVYVRGTLAGDRWRGTFRVRTRVSRNGRVVDRCRLERVTWTAEPK